MNIIKLIKKAAKAVISTIKDFMQTFKTKYEIKKAKVKAWHEYKRFANPEYIPAIIAIITGLVRIFIPMHIISTMVRVLLEGWGESAY